MRLSITLYVFMAATCMGCEVYEQNSYEEYYVVESYLLANDSLPQVRLSTTSRIMDDYNFHQNALSGAVIEIRLLNADSSVAERYRYQQKQPGIYIPLAPAIVQDERLYELYVKTATGDIIRSTTYVPKDFQTERLQQLRYVYQGEQQIEFSATPSSYITGRQSYYIFTLHVINPEWADLTPFYYDIIEEQENDIRSYYINSSGILNEDNFARDENGLIQLKVPWLAVAFYDSNDVVTSVIDDNIYDFLRSQSVQTGGIALSPGEIQNIRYNVQGGIGIFGSLASDTNRVVIARPQD